ncbi:hypothetical protein PoB_003389300 [Plakobranchus ocellatus]|uniref:Uncharacterized protein n=1 Tax=Plakobranchus ocellatus TaxID=259542 RepID=A0AAV4AJE5_9GAST|nr:hypothetical protein PoB_003389300 [Plakobranchus ocellatus]
MCVFNLIYRAVILHLASFLLPGRLGLGSIFGLIATGMCMFNPYIRGGHPGPAIVLTAWPPGAMIHIWTYHYRYMCMVNPYSRYPAHVEAPFSRGHIVLSCGTGQQGLQSLDSPADASSVTDLSPDSLDGKSIPPMARLAHATRGIGCAMVPGSIDSLKDSIPPHHVSDAGMSYVDDYNQDLQSTGREMPSLTELSEATVVDHNQPQPLQSSPKDQGPPAPTFHPTDGFPQSIFTVKAENNPENKPRRPRNPYGDPRTNARTEDPFPESQWRRRGLAEGSKQVENDTWPSSTLHSLRGLEPRFTTFVRVNCAQFRNRVRQLASRPNYPTSRDLQRDVQRDEEQVMRSVSAIPESFRSGFSAGVNSNCVQ